MDPPFSVSFYRRFFEMLRQFVLIDRPGREFVHGFEDETKGGMKWESLESVCDIVPGPCLN